MSKSRVLVVNGAPRKDGFTKEMVDLVAHGVRDAGGELEEAALRSLDIRPCLGCYGCHSPVQPGECVQHDDMSSMIERFLGCDTLVLATPLYFYSFSSLMKIYIERLFPVTGPAARLDSATGVMHPERRFLDRGPNGIALLAVGAYRSTASMDGLVKTFELITMGLDCRIAGILLRPESHFLDFPASKPLAMRKIRAAFETAGRELALHGAVSTETQRCAAAPLTRDEGMYLRHQDTYWKVFEESGETLLSREAIRDRVARDLRILMPELAACLDPQAADGLEAVIQLAFGGEEAAGWQLVIGEGHCRALIGRHEAPTTTIALDRETLVRIILQEEDPRQLYGQGKIAVSGDKSLFTRFGRLFPPPSV